ncbi:hypothetical protein [Actinomadura opuntiae]|uniref:hypothetical protein n=1 Tax=Actinomadura sp. OS1-43 TaxID=604315 RepID=UPI00255B2264|nr:hypothetical protein [Actinomadura sp. OS1-43]MDL4814182.1 hypothetical protein [Actinomadura sp. OS1-43]
MGTAAHGMGAHWTCACPRPGDDEISDFVGSAAFDTALTRAETLLHVTTHASELDRTRRHRR